MGLCFVVVVVVVLVGVRCAMSSRDLRRASWRWGSTLCPVDRHRQNFEYELVRQMCLSILINFGSRLWFAWPSDLDG